MRQSTAVNRSMYAYGGSSQPSTAALQARLLEKKKEFEAVNALEQASSLLLKQIESLSVDVDVMADAGQIHGKVLQQWPNMFHILNLFLAAREGSSSEVPSDDPTVAEGQRLVRVPIDDLQTTSSQP